MNILYMDGVGMIQPQNTIFHLADKKLGALGDFSNNVEHRQVAKNEQGSIPKGNEG
jgi:hypothetical protein